MLNTFLTASDTAPSVCTSIFLNSRWSWWRTSIPKPMILGSEGQVHDIVSIFSSQQQLATKQQKAVSRIPRKMFLSASCPSSRAREEQNATCCISRFFLFHFGDFFFFSLITTLGRLPNCRTRRRSMLLA